MQDFLSLLIIILIDEWHKARSDVLCKFSIPNQFLSNCLTRQIQNPGETAQFYDKNEKCCNIDIARERELRFKLSVADET